jgi:hypothetical protein
MNLLLFADIPEQNVSLTKPELSPVQRVREAINCLPASLNSMLTGNLPLGFKRWTIRDFHRAYTTGETTPLMVLFSSSINFYYLILIGMDAIFHFSGTDTGFMQNFLMDRKEMYM